MAYRPSSAVGKYLHGFLFNVLRVRLLVWFLCQVVSVEETVVEEGWEGCRVCNVDFVIYIQVVEVVLDCGD